MHMRIVKQRNPSLRIIVTYLSLPNTRVNSLLNLRNIQHQVMYFQTQAAIMEFNCNSTSPSRGNLTAPVMALPVEPLRQMIFDIGDVNCIYGNLFLSRLASWASNIYWESESNHSTSFLGTYASVYL